MVYEMESRIIIHTIAILLALTACQEVKEHTAPAISDRDSVSMMTTYGINTLISDSGVTKYRMVAERWDVNVLKNPNKWTFDKGVFLEQYDKKFKPMAYIQCDTAYYYDKQKIWELRGRVVYKTTDGMTYRGEELFWDENKHELYSHVFSHVVTPERELQGSSFRSDEAMRHYTVNQSKGSMVKPQENSAQPEPAKDNKANEDTIPQPPKRQMKKATRGNTFNKQQ